MLLTVPVLRISFTETGMAVSTACRFLNESINSYLRKNKFVAAMRKYPIGIQTFRKVREEGFLYIDKTQLIHQLISTGNYYFLSRPRRFGKSLLLSTIEEIFNGSKELFKGLWIEDRWDWTQKHPVIHIEFSKMPYQEVGLQEAVLRTLRKQATSLGLELRSDNVKEAFEELIEKASVKGKVVILIDEYDKPIIDYLDDIPLAEANRMVMKNFYSVIKGSDAYIRLLLITGVSRFSKVSIFSDLNNLEDITVGKKTNELTGITQAELEANFAEELNVLPAEFDTDKDGLVEKIRKWYNGYSWGGKETLYNPFSILSFMKQHEFRNFWFQTGTPTFLVKLIRKKKEFKFEQTQLNENALGNFDIADPLLSALLFQTGYLTIKGYNVTTRNYQLDYPGSGRQFAG
jgi:hypothetical protein